RRQSSRDETGSKGSLRRPSKPQSKLYCCSNLLRRLEGPTGTTERTPERPRVQDRNIGHPGFRVRVAVNTAGAAAAAGHEGVITLTLTCPPLLVTTVVPYWRPIGHCGRQWRSQFLELVVSVNRLAAENSPNGRNVRNAILGHREIVVRQDSEISELSRLDLALLAQLRGEPGVRSGPQSQRRLAIEPVCGRIDRQPADRFAGDEPEQRYPGIVRGDARGIGSGAHGHAHVQHAADRRCSLGGPMTIPFDKIL